MREDQITLIIGVGAGQPESIIDQMMLAFDTNNMLNEDPNDSHSDNDELFTK